MDQSNSSKKVLLSVIGVVVLIIVVVGVSFAFFNYTRTGGTNTLRTGQINFITTDIGGSLTNLFPVSSSVVTDSVTENVPSQVYVATVQIQGDTSYANGLDYTVSINSLDFQTSASGTNVTLPVSLDVMATSGLGSGDNTVVNNSGAYSATSTNDENALASATAHRVYTYDYKGTSGAGTATVNTVLARGYIAHGSVSGNTYTAGGVNGIIYIRAYIDSDKVFITDTAAGGDIVASGYTNGTILPNGAVQLTTSQWNSIGTSQNGATFTVKVVATAAAARPVQP